MSCDEYNYTPMVGWEDDNCSYEIPDGIFETKIWCPLCRFIYIINWCDCAALYIHSVEQKLSIINVLWILFCCVLTVDIIPKLNHIGKTLLLMNFVCIFINITHD